MIAGVTIAGSQRREILMVLPLLTAQNPKKDN
jgi:hypothetical protein